jgi:large subunit ribosomal protein L35
MIKTNKSYTKRIKVTKNGKLIARKAGRNHFNAKQSGRTRQERRRSQALTVTARNKNRFLLSA